MSPECLWIVYLHVSHPDAFTGLPEARFLAVTCGSEDGKVFVGP
jgi:hypothetical protein